MVSLNQQTEGGVPLAKMRLDRLLAGQGTQTRKEVRELIRKGRVTVNGQPEKAADRQVEPLTM